MAEQTPQELLRDMWVGHSLETYHTSSVRPGVRNHHKRCSCGFELPWTGYELAMLDHRLAAILDSDVIRERDAEKWTEGESAGWENREKYEVGMEGKPDFIPNPYLKGQ